MTSLRIKNVRKHYGHVAVLHGIDLDVEEGEFVVLVALPAAGSQRSCG